MFYPPEGLCRAEPERGPIVFTYVLFLVRKRILDFQFTGRNSQKKIPENVLFNGTGGRVDGRKSKVSFKILHTLYVYRLSIYLLMYQIKIVTNIVMGFKI